MWMLYCMSRCCRGLRSGRFLGDGESGEGERKS